MVFHKTNWSAEDSPALALMNWAEPLIEAHPAWSKVDTLDSGATLIFKNDFSYNLAGVDFYLTLRRTADAGLVHFHGSEGYNGAGLLIRPCPGSVTSLAARAADGSYGGGTGYAYTNTIHVYNPSMSPSSTDTIGLFITNDCIMLFEESSVNALYCGVFDSFHGWPNYIPLMTGDLSITSMSTSVSPFRLSRWITYDEQTPEPIVTNYVWRTQNPFAWTFTSGGVGGTAFDRNIGKVVASRMFISDKISTGNIRGNFLGLFPSYMLYMPADAGVQRFDTVVVDGDTYVYALNNQTGIWLNTDHESATP